MPPEDSGAEPELFSAPEERVAFDRFTRRLIGLARAHLDVRLQHKIEPEDVVQSVYRSFFVRYGQGLPADQEIEGLWPLLTLITVRKCADRVRYFQAERRNMARETATGGNDDRPAPWQEAVGREPTPEHVAVLAETLENLLGGLDADDRPIIEMSLQGYSTQEVSEKLGRAERSVRRLRERVRKQLERN
jgi:RNA polymerase sigma-70 factor (ECF subfamily)